MPYLSPGKSTLVNRYGIPKQSYACTEAQPLRRATVTSRVYNHTVCSNRVTPKPHLYLIQIPHTFNNLMLVVDIQIVYIQPAIVQLKQVSSQLP